MRTDIEAKEHRYLVDPYAARNSALRGVGKLSLVTWAMKYVAKGKTILLICIREIVMVIEF